MYSYSRTHFSKWQTKTRNNSLIDFKRLLKIIEYLYKYFRPKKLLVIY